MNTDGRCGRGYRIAVCAGLVLATFSAAVGAEAPRDFKLPSALGGTEFKLSAHQGQYVALHFLLKTECPVCLRHTQSYLSRTNELPGVKLVFVKPDATDDIQQWARDVEKTAPIYRDENAALAKAYGIPDGYQFHGESVHFPALILLGPDGREVFRFVGKSNRERFSVDQLKSKLAELKVAATGR